MKQFVSNKYFDLKPIYNNNDLTPQCRIIDKVNAKLKNEYVRTNYLNKCYTSYIRQEIISGFEEVRMLTLNSISDVLSEVLLYKAKPVSSRLLNNSNYSRLFPRSESELDCMLAEAENIPNELCVPAEEGFASFEERMGW